MSSQKSSAVLATAVPPKRARGRLRVAAILDAAAAVIAEKGYDGATMSEIAARSSTAIGSLYRFFPTKDALAEALLTRFVGEVETTLAAVRTRAQNLGPEGVVDALVDMMLDLKAYRAAALALLDGKLDVHAHRRTLRGAFRGGVAAILSALNPSLDAARAAIVAEIVVQMLKATRALADLGGRDAHAATDELRVALTLYVRDRTMAR